VGTCMRGRSADVNLCPQPPPLNEPPFHFPAALIGANIFRDREKKSGRNSPPPFGCRLHGKPSGGRFHTPPPFGPCQGAASEEHFGEEEILRLRWKSTTNAPFISLDFHSSSSNTIKHFTT
jgi:hypothetical protein